MNFLKDKVGDIADTVTGSDDDKKKDDNKEEDKGFIDKVKEEGKSFINGLVDKVKGDSDDEDSPSVTDKIKGEGKDLLDNIKDKGQDASSSVADTVKDKANDASEAITDKIGSRDGSGFFDKVTDKIGEKGKSVVGDVKDKIDEGKDTSEGIVDKVKDNAEDASEAVEKKMATKEGSGFFNSIGEKGKSIIDDLKDKFGFGKDDTKDVAEEEKEKTEEDSEKDSNKVPEKQASKEGSGFFDSIGDKLGGDGGGFFSNVADKLTDSEDKVTEKVDEGAKDVNDIINDITSGSRPGSGSRPKSKQSGSRPASGSKSAAGSRPTSASKRTTGSRPAFAAKSTTGSRPASSAKSTTGSRPASGSKSASGSRPASSKSKSDASESSPTSGSRPGSKQSGSRPASRQTSGSASGSRSGSKISSDGNESGDENEGTDESRDSSNLIDDPDRLNDSQSSVSSSVKSRNDTPSKKTVDFRQKSNMFDVTLKTKDGDLYCNKSVLIMWSAHFKRRFATEFKSMRKVEIELDEDVSMEEMEELLRVIYPPNKPIDESNVESVIVLAQQFESKELARRSEGYLMKIKPSSELMLKSLKHDLPAVERRCVEYLKMQSSSKWGPPDNFLDELDLSSRMKLYMERIRWLEDSATSQGQKKIELAKERFQKVLLTWSDFKQHVNDDDLDRETILDLCTEGVELASKNPGKVFDKPPEPPQKSPSLQERPPFDLRLHPGADKGGAYQPKPLKRPPNKNLISPRSGSKSDNKGARPNQSNKKPVNLSKGPKKKSPYNTSLRKKPTISPRDNDRAERESKYITDFAVSNR